MSTMTVPAETQLEVESPDDAEIFDLDLEVNLETMSTDPAITSHIICTPGCTSPGGGSFCSFCC